MFTTWLGLFLPVVSSLTLCALVANFTSTGHELDTLNFSSGDLTPWMPLRNLKSWNDGPATGAQYGYFYTVDAEVAEESDFFIVDLRGNSSKYVRMVMPDPFQNMTRYGIASLNVDEPSQRALALIVGVDVNWTWYCFLGLLNDKTGEIMKVVADFSEEMRTWAYLYDGITAWDARTGMYYLQAVVGEHQLTTLFAFNTSRTGTQVPVWHITYPYSQEGEGMFLALSISPLLESKGLGNLVTLVDDEENNGAAIWVTKGPKDYVPEVRQSVKEPGKRIPRGSRAPVKPRNHSSPISTTAILPHDTPVPWTEIIQFPRDSLFKAGFDILLDNEGNAFTTFYDRHRPVANQIVMQVDLLAGKEVARSIVKGSQRGTSIDVLVQCPSS